VEQGSDRRCARHYRQRRCEGVHPQSSGQKDDGVDDRKSSEDVCASAGALRRAANLRRLARHADTLPRIPDLHTKQKGSTPRPLQPSTLNKELKTLRALFAFARKRQWCQENVAADLEPAEDDGLPTLPFDDDEVRRILEACDRLEDDNAKTRDMNRLKMRARILVMLYTGFRISDTVRLERKRVDLETGKLLIRMMRTRRPMYATLPKEVIQALKALPEDSPYFFWSRKSKLSTAIGNARRSVSRVCQFAGIEKGHPHRFRDTFAVELLRNGASLHTVQLLLGHGSIRSTEKHYAPFVLEFQRVIDAATAKLTFTNRTKNRTRSGKGHQDVERKA
jgi:integrase/recombinase XerD